MSYQTNSASISAVVMNVAMTLDAVSTGSAFGVSGKSIAAYVVGNSPVNSTSGPGIVFSSN